MRNRQRLSLKYFKAIVIDIKKVKYQYNKGHAVKQQRRRGRYRVNVGCGKIN